MHNDQIRLAGNRVFGPQAQKALDSLIDVVLDGLNHGFFDYSISCEVGNKGKRMVVIKAGKSHRFTIPEEELPR